MNVFDLLGPVMVGPSSSHTAGAVAIGRMVRALLGSCPVEASIGLYGSFATTGEGHGTPRALVAGLLGFAPDDSRVPHSFELAEELGLAFSFHTVSLRDAHPNSTLITATDANGRQVEVGASSPGGGRMTVFSLDGAAVSFGGELPTLVIHNNDRPGCLSRVTALLAQQSINLATLQLARNDRGGTAVMVAQCDQKLSPHVVEELKTLSGILQVTCYNPE